MAENDFQDRKLGIFLLLFSSTLPARWNWESFCFLLPSNSKSQQDETGNLFFFFPFNSTLRARWNWDLFFCFCFFPPFNSNFQQDETGNLDETGNFFLFSSTLPARCRLMAPATTVSTPAWQAPSVWLSPNLLISSWPTSWRSPWSLMASLRVKQSWHTGEAWWTLLSVLSCTMMPT